MSIEELEKIKLNPNKDVVSASFSAALEGIEKGYMDYQKDIVLETILKRVKEEINKFKNLNEK